MARYITPNTSKVLKSFLTDCIVRQLAENTIQGYSYNLGRFIDWAGDPEIIEVDPNLLRQYIQHLQETNHNPGGVHLHYRFLRTWLLWWENETDGDYRSPTHKVKAPKRSNEPMDPVDLDDVSALLKTCDHTYYGLRDRALITIMVDTGSRATELLEVTVDKVDRVMGSITVLGKGSKTRTLYMGTTARKALRRWMQVHPGASFLFTDSTRKQGLGYHGLRHMLKKRANLAGVPTPKTHAFRRAYALSMLRAGTDIFTLAKLLGHRNTRTLEHYIKLDYSDMELAQRNNSVADRL